MQNDSRLSAVRQIVDIINKTQPILISEEKKTIALKKVFNVWLDKKILETSTNPNLSDNDKLSMLNNYTESKM